MLEAVPARHRGARLRRGFACIARPTYSRRVSWSADEPVCQHVWRWPLASKMAPPSLSSEYLRRHMRPMTKGQFSRGDVALTCVTLGGGFCSGLSPGLLAEDQGRGANKMDKSIAVAEMGLHAAEESLFKRWSAARTSFVPDGVVDEDVYSASTLKVIPRNCRRQTASWTSGRSCTGQFSLPASGSAGAVLDCEWPRPRCRSAR